MVTFCRDNNRANRGGSWNNNASNCTVSNRNTNNPDNRNNNLGFRVVLVPNSGKRWMPFSEQKRYLFRAGQLRRGQKHLGAVSGRLVDAISKAAKPFLPW